VIGGDHSISSGFCQGPLFEQNPSLSVVQIDTHSDLRDGYLGSKRHASIMARVREMAHNTLQVGMRAISP
jgi:arginase family enzyme